MFIYHFILFHCKYCYSSNCKQGWNLRRCSGKELIKKRLKKREIYTFFFFSSFLALLLLLHMQLRQFFNFVYIDLLHLLTLDNNTVFNNILQRYHHMVNRHQHMVNRHHHMDQVQLINVINQLIKQKEFDW